MRAYARGREVMQVGRWDLGKSLGRDILEHQCYENAGMRAIFKNI
jgi:hypothetical protein